MDNNCFFFFTMTILTMHVIWCQKRLPERILHAVIRPRVMLVSMFVSVFPWLCLIVYVNEHFFLSGYYYYIILGHVY